ncbi:uncharacterized protein [Palaemon carinicauda]|uniref:uncharacterized protein n=1 Tax=Palaemon carinicauda TaxID=392227 RepID=UPI0035B5AECD
MKPLKASFSINQSIYNRRSSAGIMISFDKLLFAVAMFGCGVCVATEDADILRTVGSLSASVTLPQNESTSTLMFWTDLPYVKVHLNILATYTYDVEITVNQTGIWHIAYLYQPASSPQNRSSLVVPSCSKYMSFTEHEIFNITLSSENEVYWMFCGNIYACELQAPFATTSGVKVKGSSEGPGDYVFGLLIGISALCVILVIVIVILVIFLVRIKKTEHHYEKALWPPIAPPPLPESLSSSLDRRVDANVIRKESPDNQGCERGSIEQPPMAYVTWNDVTEDPRASILDYQSVNSVYGMAIS